MSFSDPSPLLRQCCLAPSAPPGHAQVLQLLLAQDGSTTLLCETVAGGPVTLQLLLQQQVQDVPPIVRSVLPGERFIERVTCLIAHGQVMMDNLSYIALDALAPDVQRDLEAGTMPIGHLFARMWTRRHFLAPQPVLHARLWAAVDGPPDAQASRSYSVVTPQGPCMLITETFRRGMLMQPPATGA